MKLATTERATPKSDNQLIDSIIADLKNAGFSNRDSKYLILYQDRNGCSGVIGQSTILSDTKNYYDNRNNGEYGSGASYSINYDCFFSSASLGAHVFMHELVHGMGGTQQTSPNHDGTSPFHPRDESDLMAYGGNTFGRCGITWGGVEDIDCYEDDYWAGWGHDGYPSSWISQNWDTGDCWNRFQTLLDAGSYNRRFCGEEYRLRPGVYQR